MAAELSKEDKLVELMFHRSAQMRQCGRPLIGALALPLLAIYLLGAPLITDMKHELIASVQGMPLSTTSSRLIAVAPDTFRIVYTHDYIDSVYDYHKYIETHYNATVDDGNSTLSQFIYKITPFVPDLKYEQLDIGIPSEDILSKPLQERFDNFLWDVALSAIPLIFLMGLYGLRVMQLQRLMSKSYCSNCHHALVLHLGRDFEFHRCEKLVKIPQERLDNNWVDKHVPGREPCDCINFKLLPPEMIGKKPGQVKVSSAPPHPALLIFMMFALIGFLQFVVTPFTSAHDSANDIAADLKIGKHYELLRQASYNVGHASMIGVGNMRSQFWEIKQIE